MGSRGSTNNIIINYSILFLHEIVVLSQNGGCYINDETIGHWKGFQQPIKRRDFGNRTRGQLGQMGNFHNFRGRDDVDGDLDTIKLKIPTFQGKKDPKEYSGIKKVELIFKCYSYSEVRKVKLVVIEFTDYTLIWWD